MLSKFLLSSGEVRMREPRSGLSMALPKGEEVNSSLAEEIDLCK
jgi:hypothetical protein